MLKNANALLKPAFLALLLSVASVARSAETTTVESSDLGNAVIIRGRLGQPLGKIISISGAVVEKEFVRSKEDSGSTVLFRVKKVNGKVLRRPVIIRFGGFRVPALLPGEARTLRGYETGFFTGMPEAAWREFDRTTGPIATPSWHFKTEFQVIPSLTP